MVGHWIDEMVGLLAGSTADWKTGRVAYWEANARRQERTRGHNVTADWISFV